MKAWDVYGVAKIVANIKMIDLYSAIKEVIDELNLSKEEKNELYEETVFLKEEFELDTL